MQVTQTMAAPVTALPTNGPVVAPAKPNFVRRIQAGWNRLAFEEKCMIGAVGFYATAIALALASNKARTGSFFPEPTQPRHIAENWTSVVLHDSRTGEHISMHLSPQAEAMFMARPKGLFSR